MQVFHKKSGRPRSMSVFELHVYKNDNWLWIDSFQNKAAALSAAFHLEQARRFSAIRVVNEAYDDEQNVFNQKLIYTWSASREKRVKDFETKKYLERVRRTRKKKLQDKLPGKEKQQPKANKKTNKVILISCAVVTVFALLNALNNLLI